MRLVWHELVFLIERRSLNIRDPVIEKIVGLRLERIGADGDDRVGEFGVLVAIVEFADAQTAWERPSLWRESGAIHHSTSAV
jgi:hypothetical protein